MDVSAGPGISVVGCGWLGLPLARRLAELGYEVKGTTTSIDKLVRLEEAGVKPYLLRVTDRLEGDVDDLFVGQVLIINIPPGRRNPDVREYHPRQIQQLVDRSILDGVRHIIFISSTGVYKNTGGFVDESGQLQPIRSSGQALVAAEHIVSDSGLDWTILRMAGLVGGERQPGRWFAGKRDVPDGDTSVNMVHRADCIAAIVKVVQSGPSCDVYNICSDEHPPKKEFYKAQSSKINVPPPTFLNGVGPHKIVDNRKFKAKFDFAYHHPDPILF